MMLVGIVLAAVGGFILVRGVEYGKDRSVLKVGDFEATVEERRAVPPWVGGVALAAGVLLVATGVGRRQ